MDQDNSENERKSAKRAKPKPRYKVEEDETFLMSFKRWVLGIDQHAREMNRKQMVRTVKSRGT